VSRVKPAEVHYYVDADILGLGLVLARLRSDVTYPGDPGAVIHKRERPACVVTTPHAPDTEWIPIAAQHRWLIITRDRQIQEHRREIGAVREHGARMIALSGQDARGTFDQLEIVMTQWRAIARLLVEPGPFIYTATRTSLKPVSLD
jgi:PIN domain-containing protein